MKLGFSGKLTEYEFLGVSLLSRQMNFKKKLKAQNS